MDPVYIVSLSYFLIGAIAILLINKRKPEGAKGLWLKFVTYFFIVHFILFSFRVPDIQFGIAALISLLALYEWQKIYPFKQKSWWVFFLSTPLLLLFLFCFLNFYTTCLTSTKTYTYLLVFCFDGFSQICGQLFGKRKLTFISPNKTIEGTVGGFVVTGITVYLMAPHEFSLVLIALMMAISLLGDLATSAYKRYCGVKDFSNLIPGHGGFLDRFDSFIPTGAFAWVLFGGLAS